MNPNLFNEGATSNQELLRRYFGTSSVYVVKPLWDGVPQQKRKPIFGALVATDYTKAQAYAFITYLEDFKHGDEENPKYFVDVIKNPYVISLTTSYQKMYLCPRKVTLATLRGYTLGTVST